MKGESTPVRRRLRALILTGLVLLGLGWPAAALAAPATVVRHGPTHKPRIALTFDDGLSPPRAAATVQVLRDYDVRATIFVMAQDVYAHPEVARQIAAGGFEVGDHSASHVSLPTVSYGRMLQEIGAGARLFTEYTGVKTSRFFRPPYGATNSLVAQAAGERGYPYVVLWDVDPQDWRGYSAGTIASSVLSNAHSGAIILLHLSAPHTFEALPAIITGLRDRGYELVTLAGLLKGDRRFFDLNESTPGGQALLRLVDAGVMSGYNPDYIGPYDPMTRAQLAKVAVLVAGTHTAPIEHPQSPTFADVPAARDGAGQLLTYPFDFVEEAAAGGLVTGYQDGEGRWLFDPHRAITRGQAASIVARMAQQLKGYPATLPDAPPVGFTDVPEYARGEVQLAAQLGLIRGYSSERFDFWSAAQRRHLAMIMTRFLDLPAYVPPATTTTTAPSTTTTAPSTTTTAATTTTTGATTTTTPDGSTTTTTTTTTTLLP